MTTKHKKLVFCTQLANVLPVHVSADWMRVDEFLLDELLLNEKLNYSKFAHIAF